MYPPAAPLIVLVVVALSALATSNGFCWAFSAQPNIAHTRGRSRRGGVWRDVGVASNTAIAATTNTGNDFLAEKVKLVTLCTQGSKPSLTQVQSCVKGLEQMAERPGFGPRLHHPRDFSTENGKESTYLFSVVVAPFAHHVHVGDYPRIAHSHTYSPLPCHHRRVSFSFCDIDT
jgi:hypothetical protein